jgi:hypothetical protein
LQLALGREVVAPGKRDGERGGGLAAECSLDEELAVSNLNFYKNDRQRKYINAVLINKSTYSSQQRPEFILWTRFFMQYFKRKKATRTRKMPMTHFTKKVQKPPNQSWKSSKESSKNFFESPKTSKYFHSKNSKKFVGLFLL